MEAPPCLQRLLLLGEASVVLRLGEGGGGDGIGVGVGGSVLVWRCSCILLVLKLALNDLGLHWQQRWRQCPSPTLFQYPLGP